MKTPLLMRYFALVLIGIVVSELIQLIADVQDGIATPFMYFGFLIYAGVLGVAYRLWHLRRWALIFFVAEAIMGTTQLTHSYVFLVHAIASTLVLVFRWRDLKDGL